MQEIQSAAAVVPLAEAPSADAPSASICPSDVSSSVPPFRTQSLSFALRHPHQSLSAQNILTRLPLIMPVSTLCSLSYILLPPLLLPPPLPLLLRSLAGFFL